MHSGAFVVLLLLFLSSLLLNLVGMSDTKKLDFFFITGKNLKIIK